MCVSRNASGAVTPGPRPSASGAVAPMPRSRARHRAQGTGRKAMGGLWLAAKDDKPAAALLVESAADARSVLTPPPSPGRALVVSTAGVCTAQSRNGWSRSTPRDSIAASTPTAPGIGPQSPERPMQSLSCASSWTRLIPDCFTHYGNKHERQPSEGSGIQLHPSGNAQSREPDRGGSGLMHACPLAVSLHWKRIWAPARPFNGAGSRTPSPSWNFMHVQPVPNRMYPRH